MDGFGSSLEDDGFPEDYDFEADRELEVGFICPRCGHPAAAYVLPPEEWTGEVSHRVACLNSEDAHEWTVRISKHRGELSAQLDENEDTKVSLSLPGIPDEWYEPLPEPEAYGIFVDALKEWRNNVDEFATMDGFSSRNRMLFSTLYSIAEAYLSDSIIGAALADKEIQRHMLKLDVLKDKQVNLKTILDKPTIVQDMIKEALQRFSFHNLPAVHGICERAFGARILPANKDDRTMVIASVAKRHDCVHRNGFDKEGNRHMDISSDYLRKLCNIFESMAEALENGIREAGAKKFFENLGPEQEQSGDTAA
ncbi:hypothetical protein [Rhizobium sp. BK176]|uniref:hypothetical protein n=1 Tax=Rhizobium sp. BK176 TaxID=2587071 RepID=UPI00216A727B|nr:hypothetical protein [Rhizobium sp. BK176]MCS4092624.1 hypothetical protein [Rhizobium sp. BK176]